MVKVSDLPTQHWNLCPDSDEEGRAKFVKKLKKGIKQIKVPGNNDASHEKEPANSSLFVIDIGGDGTKKSKVYLC